MPVKKALVLGRKLTVAEADGNFNWLSGSPASVTIAGDILTVDGTNWYRVETEAAAASDNIVRINGTSLGDVVHLYILTAGRTVIVRHDGSFLHLLNGQHFVMNTIYSNILLRSFGSNVLVEIWRSSVV
jgi:hypothetical protein